MLADKPTLRISILACGGVTAFLLVTASATGAGEGRKPAFQDFHHTVNQPGGKKLSKTYTPAKQEEAARSPKSKPSEKAAATPYMPPDFGKQTNFRALLSRVLVATLGVLIACCASIWLGKRFLTQSLAKPDTNSSLKLLATLPVSRRGCVQLVQADDTKLVVTIDGGALKSVIPLTESFGKTLFDASEDPEVGIPRKRNANEKTG